MIKLHCRVGVIGFPLREMPSIPPRLRCFSPLKTPGDKKKSNGSNEDLDTKNPDQPQTSFRLYVVSAQGPRLGDRSVIE